MKDCVLVVGSTGLLGSALLKVGSKVGESVVGTVSGRHRNSKRGVRFDLTENLEVWSPPTNCGAAILCAGVTSLDACRLDRSTTRYINVTQTLRLTERLLAAGIFVVFISSNLVFDGTLPQRGPDDEFSPLTEYGRQKAIVESCLKEFGERIAIVRLTKVASPKWSLVQNWMHSLRSGQTVEAFGDFVCSPIPLELTAWGLLEIARKQRSGVWQFSGDSDISYADIAKHIALRMGVDGSLVRITSSLGKTEHSPLHTTLDATRARRLLDLSFPAPHSLIANIFNL